MEIREIDKADVGEFVRLAKELGYEADEAHTASRIENRNEMEIVLVAEENESLISWIDCKIVQSYMAKPYCEIVGFVVDERERNKGIGKQMMAAAEKWIREKGIEKIAIRSNVKRIPAHKFYEKNGYHIVKQQMIFNKLLKP